jgi:hypothetical protein
VGIGQVNRNPEKPRIKSTVALEGIDFLYQFDKRLLRKFRGIVTILTDFEDYVMDAVLILYYETLGRIGVALAAFLHQNAVIENDIFDLPVQLASPLRYEYPALHPQSPIGKHVPTKTGEGQPLSPWLRGQKKTAIRREVGPRH